MTSTTAVGAAAASLVLVAAAIVAAQPRSVAGPRSAEFQRIVGGLGAGPAIDLSVCAPDFDPRVADVCRGDLDPIPGGGAFCAHLGGSALFDGR